MRLRPNSALETIPRLEHRARPNNGGCFAIMQENQEAEWEQLRYSTLAFLGKPTRYELTQFSFSLRI